ncbi:MAG: L,D-transpeptidase [Terracidiphilus sp.]
MSRTAVVAAVAALMAAQAFGLDGDRQTEPQQSKSAVAAKQPVQAAGTVTREIVVSLADRKLALMENGKVVRIYRVAVGKRTTPSPVGTFTIERRVVNPVYEHEGRVIQPGPGNPVGNRWMGLSIRGYGIHGTNVPSSIGKAASLGCIRMGKTDVEDLFSRVRVGDAVELVKTRNEETAQIFGDGPKPPAATAVVLRAKVEAAPVKVRPAVASNAADQTVHGADVLLNVLARAGAASATASGLMGTL